MLRFTGFCLLSLALHLLCGQLLAQSLGGAQRPLAAAAAAPLEVQFVLLAESSKPLAAPAVRPAPLLPEVPRAALSDSARAQPRAVAAARPAPAHAAPSKPASQPASPAQVVAAAPSSSMRPVAQPVAAREVFSSQPQFAQAPSAPVYPSQARRRNQQGVVLVEVRLDALGTQRERRLLRSSGVGSLDQAALHAVAGWQFRAEVRDGQAVPSRLHIPIQFTLATRR